MPAGLRLALDAVDASSSVISRESVHLEKGMGPEDLNPDLKIMSLQLLTS